MLRNYGIMKVLDKVLALLGGKQVKQNKLYNVAIYCRLSLDGGNEGDSSSIKTQKNNVRRICERKRI